MNTQELKQLRLINQLRNLDLNPQELSEINHLENKIILDLKNLNKEELDFLYYLADKYHLIF